MLLLCQEYNLPKPREVHRSVFVPTDALSFFVIGRKRLFMPWKVKEENGKYCVFKEGGEKLKCYSDKAQADNYVKALYANSNEKLEGLKAIMLEEHGPVISGIAITNDPHLPLPPIGVVDIDGEKIIRVPFLRKGIFSHPNGNLVFDDAVFDKMLDNHSKAVSHSGVKLRETHAGKSALSWFDARKNGRIAKEVDPDFGEILVAYGKPTSNKALEMIESGEYGYASVEWYPNYKDKMLKKLSTEDILDELSVEDLVDLSQVEVIELEEPMEDKTISLEEYNTLVQAKEKLTEAEAKITELEKKLETPVVEDSVELPEDVKRMLEEQKKEINTLKRNAWATQVDLIVSKAQTYRDEDGKGHAPILLEVVKKALLGEAITFGDTEIKLENREASNVADYYRKVFISLLENLPGQVKFESQIELEDTPNPMSGGRTFTQEDYKYLWATSEGEL